MKSLIPTGLASTALTLGLIVASPSFAAYNELIEEGAVDKIIKENKRLFKELKIIDPAAIRCYRAGILGNEKAARHAYVLAANTEMMMKIINRASPENPDSPLDYAKYLDDVESNPLVEENVRIIERFRHSKRYCSLLLASDPDEVERIKAVIKKLEGSK